MRTAYKVLAHLVAIGVAIQAAAIAYAFFGLGAWIQGGGVLDKAAMESESTDFAGSGGFAVHGIGGEIVIPLIAVVLLLVAFGARIPGGVAWAGAVVGVVVVQVALGLFAHSVPSLGMLHGIVALALFAVALIAGRRVDSAATRPAPAEPARVA